MKMELSGAEVAQHDNRKSCWIVIDSKIYDITSFIAQHPGGAAVLLKQAGSDATDEFNAVHSPAYLEDLPAECYIGLLKPETRNLLKPGKKEASISPNAPGKEPTVPHVSTCVAVSDFEAHAKAVLAKKAWIYASSSANSGLSMKGNIDDWSLVTFRPRVLRRVGQVDTQTSILGHKTQFPFYASPMGTMGGLNPKAEPELVRGAVRRGVHAVVSTASTKTYEEIMRSLVDEQQLFDNRSPSRLFFQLYINEDKQKAIDLLRGVKKAGYKGLWITVDTPVLGKRLADRRLQAEEALEVGLEQEKGKEGSEDRFAPATGGRAIPGALSPNTTWEDLAWIREEWDGPIVLKGIQCAEDAKLAVEHGCQGILLSNHGGRQIHSAPSALATLLEIRTYYPEVLGKIEILVDGGVRDGGDVLKALCMGATGVGIGRPLLYALAAYGSEGVERCIDILSEELSIAMRLLGITSLDQVRPEMVNASRILNTIWRPTAGVKSHL